MLLLIIVLVCCSAVAADTTVIPGGVQVEAWAFSAPSCWWFWFCT